MISPVLPTYARAPLSFVEGSGPWLIDESGERYLDMGAGIAVNALGHAHPKLVAALEEQGRRLWHTSNLYRIPNQEKLARLLVDNSFADTVFFTNSGTESVELAIKMARKHFFDADQPERVEIVTFEGCFHGRSTGAIAASGSEKMTKGFGPLMPGFRTVPWEDMEAARAAAGPNTAAIMVEPVQGEGGIRVLPREMLRELRSICDEAGCLLVLDEIQCGIGRTGRLFAHELAGVKPDVMCIAKAIGGGFPLGAVLATEEAASGMTAGTHGSTYGGNPLGCAVGCAVLEEVLSDGFLDRVNRVAGAFRQKLAALVDSHPDVFERVQGEGLMLGLRCKAPNMDVVNAGYDARILMVPAAENVVRFLPPLNITDEEIEECLRRLETASEAVEAKLSAEQGA